jgi:hypothetical protein
MVLWYYGAMAVDVMPGMMEDILEASRTTQRCISFSMYPTIHLPVSMDCNTIGRIKGVFTRSVSELYLDVEATGALTGRYIGATDDLSTGLTNAPFFLKITSAYINIYNDRPELCDLILATLRGSLYTDCLTSTVSTSKEACILSPSLVQKKPTCVHPCESENVSIQSTCLVNQLPRNVDELSQQADWFAHSLSFVLKPQYR